jgi:hypothetical protein
MRRSGGSRRSISSRPSRRPTRASRGSVGVIAYPDTYADYHDTYPDYGDYNDTYPDYNDGNYQDYGDYNDESGRLPDPWSGRPIDQKIIILEYDRSYLLEGDPDLSSSLFEDLKPDDKGRKSGVLPMLLNQGWQTAKLTPPDNSGRSIVVLQRPKPGKR